ncbi:hypothetical protein [Enterobacter cloacae]|uniref:hypothetical protein n=1 Tax=Enterobacter cloacae TaxID=550 RepID=UPI00188C2887|nr:hypothetical protein [Enterobacter cloacae]MBF4112045.1 hypothetical protein [Enterobacter cloacae]MDT8889842.1 hypothetical protein [Enterobacter cloacae]
MKVTDEALLHSGFTQPELQKIKSNVEKYGGTLGEAINDLARRFVTLAVVVAVCTFILLLLIVFSSPDRVIAWGLAMIFGVAIMSFAQPPVISYKSWRYRKTIKD